jgi:hypothetical protein
MAHLQWSDDERRQQSSYEHCSSKFGFCWKEENLKILVAKGTFKIGKMTRAAKNVILYNIPNVRGSYSTFSFWWFTQELQTDIDGVFDSCFGSFPPFVSSFSLRVTTVSSNGIGTDAVSWDLEYMCEMSRADTTGWAPNVHVVHRDLSLLGGVINHEWISRHTRHVAASKTWNLTDDKQWRRVSCQKWSWKGSHFLRNSKHNHGKAQGCSCNHQREGRSESRRSESEEM